MYPEEPTTLERIRVVLSTFTEEDFDRSGYSFTYKAARILLDHINELEIELEMMRMTNDSDT